MAYRDAPINYRRIELHHYDKDEIRDVLENRLRQYFNDVEVAWIPCPVDISEEQFNFNALGFFGNSELIKIGDALSHSNPYQRIEKTYDFKEILRVLGRDNKDSYVFGNGICQGPSGKLGELVLNTSFLQRNNVLVARPDNGYITYLDPESNKCQKEMLTEDNLKSIIEGSFYVCDEFDKSYPVENYTEILFVYAKKPQSQVTFEGGKKFIQLMQEILHQTFGYIYHYIALGGVHKVERRSWEHVMIPNDWEDQFLADNTFCYINCPETIISTFIGSTNTLLSFSTEPPLTVNSCESVHSLIHHSSAQRTCFEFRSPIIEYAGAFNLADFLYCFD